MRISLDALRPGLFGVAIRQKSLHICSMVGGDSVLLIACELLKTSGAATPEDKPVGRHSPDHVVARATCTRNGLDRWPAQAAPQRMTHRAWLVHPHRVDPRG